MRLVAPPPNSSDEGVAASCLGAEVCTRRLTISARKTRRSKPGSRPSSGDGGRYLPRQRGRFSRRRPKDRPASGAGLELSWRSRHELRIGVPGRAGQFLTCVARRRHRLGRGRRRKMEGSTSARATALPFPVKHTGPTQPKTCRRPVPGPVAGLEDQFYGRRCIVDQFKALDPDTLQDGRPRDNLPHTSSRTTPPSSSADGPTQTPRRPRDPLASQR